MNLTKEQLEALESMGYTLLSPEMAAIKLEVDELSLRDELQRIGSAARRAYYKGYIRQLIETRNAIIKAAHNGSNPAQQEILKMITRLQNQLIHI